jgi:peptidoglycan/LPS O-acetylase OafA/YrhL
MDFARIRRAFSFKANFRSVWERPGERYAAIDGLRAISMLWVVLTHLCLVVSRFVPYDAYVGMMDRNRWLFSWVFHGEKALDSFFVISGFLIGLMLLNEHEKRGRIQLGRFFARRYLRLMPAYAVALVVLYVSGVEGPEKSSYVWANILYVNNFLPQRHMFMDPSWSLAVEEQFYVCLPLFLIGIFFQARSRLASLVTLFGLSLVICAVVLAVHPNVTHTQYGENFIVCSPHFSSEYFDSLYVNLYTRFAPFVLGLGLAWASVSREAQMKELFARWRGLSDGLLVAGTAALVAVLLVPAFDPHVTIPHPLLYAFVLLHRHVWSVGVLFVMTALLFPGGALSRGVSWFLAARVWYPIAQLSYCSYLFHLGCVLPGLFLALHLLRPGVAFQDGLLVLGAPDLVLAYVLTLSFAFLVGTVMYVLVERPFLNLRPR